HHFPESEQLEYPHGTFEGLFYAEELRSAKSLGYKIKPQFGYLFSTFDLFSKYVNHFYRLKSLVKGGERFIIKSLLNHLYGYFGRNPYNPSTLVVNQTELLKLLSKHPARNVISLTNDLSLINYHPYKQISNNKTLTTRPANTNVAIASAITAQSRVYI